MSSPKDNSSSDLPNRKRDFSQQLTPITAEGERPQKRFYRQRAHCNPLAHNDSYEYPVCPAVMQWSNAESGWFYPETQGVPTVLDIGCGFGGLTMALATQLPNETVLGMEIRAKVTEYVRLRIVAARKEENTHHNAAVLRTNSMKFLPNYFDKHSIHKILLCFPDPHFKRKNHPRRIISVRLLSEYAFVLKPGTGKLYCITDVKELHEWHVAHCDAHPLFRRIVVSTDDKNQYNVDEDPCIHTMITATEEGQKVDRNGGEKFYAVYERIADSEAEKVDASNFFGISK